MAFNFGAFQQGVSNSKKEIAAQRKDNAALYGDFIKSNPSASAGDREAFANNLAGNNKGYRAALPSRSMMESNVSAYNQKQAAATAARDRKTKLQNIKIVGEASNYMSDLLQTMDSDKALSNVELVFGDLLDKEMLPAVQSSADRMGWQKYSKTAAPLLQSFSANPNQASLDALKMEGYNPVYGDRLIASQRGTLSRAKTAAIASAEAAHMQAAMSTDVLSPDAMRVLENSLLAKHTGLLSEADLQPSFANGNKEFDRRLGLYQTGETSKAQGFANEVAQSITSSDSIQFSTLEEALRQYDDKIAASGVLPEFVTDTARQSVADAWRDRNQTDLDAINLAEDQKALKQTQELTQDRQTTEVTPADLQGVFLSALEDATDKGAVTGAKYDATIEANKAFGVLRNTAIDLNIDIKDSAFVNQWVAAANKLRENQGAFEEVGVELDRSHFLAALDEMSYLGATDANSIAMRRALTNVGLANFSGMDEGKYAQFSAAVNDELGKIVKAKTDIFSRQDTTLDNRITGASDTLQASVSSFAGDDLDNMTAKAAALLNEDVSPRSDAGTFEDINKWGLEAQSYVGRLVGESRRLTNEANRLRTITTHPHFSSDLPRVQAALLKADELDTKAQEYLTNSQAVASQGRKLKEVQRISNVTPEQVEATGADGQPLIGPNGQPIRTDADTVKTTAIAQIAGNTNTQITKRNGTANEMTPAQIFGYVYQQAQKAQKANPKAVPMITQYGNGALLNGKTVTGELAFGPYLEAITAPTGAEVLLQGNQNLMNTVPNFEPFMKSIYEELGLPFPTATEARIMMEGTTFAEDFQSGMEGIGEAIGQRVQDFMGR